MRKTATIIITDEGRDKGKYFLITEMPAIPATKWGIRAIQAAIRAGVNIPDDIASRGMEAVWSVGIQTLVLMNFVDMEPLMDELMPCIKIVRDTKHPELAFDMLPGGDDIEEPSTVLKLQREVISLHLNFLTSVSNSQSTSTPPSQSTSTNTKTSRPLSGRLSPRKSHRL